MKEDYEEDEEEYTGAGRQMSNQDFDRLFINKFNKKSKLYGGVFMKDELEDMKPEENKFYIINLDKVGGGGTHWVLISNLNPTNIIYIDSFAVPPADVVVNFMKRAYKLNRNGSESKHRKTIYYNTITLQADDSINCGYYIAYFAQQLIKKRNIVDIISDFNLTNDKLSKWMNETLIEKIKRNCILGII